MPRDARAYLADVVESCDAISILDGLRKGAVSDQPAPPPQLGR